MCKADSENQKIKNHWWLSKEWSGDRTLQLCGRLSLCMLHSLSQAIVEMKKLKKKGDLTSLQEATDVIPWLEEFLPKKISPWRLRGEEMSFTSSALHGSENSIWQVHGENLKKSYCQEK